MKAPQIIFLSIMGLGLLLTARDHGKPRGPENMWIALVATAISLGLLFWGGFFK